MADIEPWAFDESLQPREGDVGFDLARALDSMVLLRAEIPEDAFTGDILGTERVGYGAVIRADGLVLTIGYLITEAETIWLTTNAGTVVAGHALAYDQATGFGLVQSLGDLRAPALERGSSAALGAGDDVFVLGHGGRAHALKARVIAKREFAGYWEYLIEDALFTAPAHPQWGGAALLDAGGRLAGIGSLLLRKPWARRRSRAICSCRSTCSNLSWRACLRTGAARTRRAPGSGCARRKRRGGLSSVDWRRAAQPRRAGVQPGDLVLGVGSMHTGSLADFLRKVWRLGDPGVEVPLMLARQGDVLRLSVRSADRNDFLKKPRLH